MILRTTWILLAALFWLAPAPARAETDFITPVISRLESEGFSVTEIKRTWLGRILITAVNQDSLREIVLNRHNGEVLRDRLFALDHDIAPGPDVMPDSGGTGMERDGDMGGGGGMGDMGGGRDSMRP